MFPVQYTTHITKIAGKANGWDTRELVWCRRVDSISERAVDARRRGKVGRRGVYARQWTSNTKAGMFARLARRVRGRNLQGGGSNEFQPIGQKESDKHEVDGRAIGSESVRSSESRTERWLICFWEGMDCIPECDWCHHSDAGWWKYVSWQSWPWNVAPRHSRNWEPVQ